MSAGEIFLLVVRWVHLVSAAAWVGGSLFYLVVLRPNVRRAPESSRALSVAAATKFRAIVNTCIVLLVATGVILGFDRLAQGIVEAPYVVTLGVKSALSVWMFVIVRDQRRQSAVMDAYRKSPQQEATGVRRIGRALAGYNALVILGVVVFFLSDLLKVLFEMALSGG